MKCQEETSSDQYELPMFQQLYEACKNGETEKFKSLAAKGALKEVEEYSARDEGLEYAMHGSALEEAARGHRELLDLILTYPPYLAERSLHGAMSGACEAGRLDLAKETGGSTGTAA